VSAYFSEPIESTQNEKSLIQAVMAEHTGKNSTQSKLAIRSLNRFQVDYLLEFYNMLIYQIDVMGCSVFNRTPVRFPMLFQKLRQ
jgi:hypothetical protein